MCAGDCQGCRPQAVKTAHTRGCHAELRLLSIAHRTLGKAPCNAGLMQFVQLRAQLDINDGLDELVLGSCLP